MATKPHLPAIFLPFPQGALCARPEVDDETFTTSFLAINDPESRMFLSAQNQPQSAASQRDWWTKPAKDDDIQLFLWYDQRYIGGMGVHNISYIHGTATTGTFVWLPKYRNRGIATMAKLVLLDHLFNTLNLRIVYSHVIGYNARSARYRDKCGYTEIARFPKRFRFGDVLVDEVVLQVTRESWLPFFTDFQKKHCDADGAYLTRRELLEKK
jgi:RimJ/RimL family protein N-acetyltransferase